MKIADIELDGINNKGGDNVISTNTAVNDDSENEIVTEEERERWFYSNFAFVGRIAHMHKSASPLLSALNHSVVYDRQMSNGASAPAASPFPWVRIE